MWEYLIKHYDDLLEALLEHLQIVVITLFFSLLLAAVLTIVSVYLKKLGEVLIQLSGILYSVPSLALFALLIPVTGLGMTTAVIVLTGYNQYLLLRNFLTGLAEVDPAITEAATGLGMNTLQILVRVQIPLAKRALFTGIKLAVVSTIGIATIAAMINAGGLGSILFDGLRTMNVNKIVWGSLLSAGLALGINACFSAAEKRLNVKN
ncbi:ABC transporter permease [Roseburia hominis]